MKLIKFISFCLGALLLFFPLEAQDLVMQKLTNKDKGKKMYNTYEYNATDHYAHMKLCLYQDRTFYYSLKTFNQNVFSQGKWSYQGDTLILTNNIRNGHVPIKLSYSKDGSALIRDFKVGIVKNLKGEEMPDGLIVINNDSIKCAPSYGICDYSYSTIDSIKIVFENGLSSEWIKINNKDYMQIIPTVQTNFLISSYMVFDKKRYLLQKSILKPID